MQRGCYFFLLKTVRITQCASILIQHICIPHAYAVSIAPVALSSCLQFLYGNHIVLYSCNLSLTMFCLLCFFLLVCYFSKLILGILYLLLANRSNFLSFSTINVHTPVVDSILEQWYSTFFVCIPPDVLPIQLCTPKVVDV
jgi:hypothetical protein